MFMAMSFCRLFYNYLRRIYFISIPLFGHLANNGQVLSIHLGMTLDFKLKFFLKALASLGVVMSVTQSVYQKATLFFKSESSQSVSRLVSQSQASQSVSKFVNHTAKMTM